MHAARQPRRSYNRVGTHWAFAAAVGIIATWGATGPLFGFSQQSLFIINSFTTIVTFLMVSSAHLLCAAPRF